MSTEGNKTQFVTRKKGIFSRFFYGLDYLLHIRLRTVWSRLRDRQAQLDIVAKNMKDGVVLFDRKMRPVFVNQAAKRILKAGDDFTAIRDNFEKAFPGVDMNKCFGATSEKTPFIVPEIDCDGGVYQLIFSKIPECSDEQCEVFGSLWIEDVTESKVLERRKSEFVSVVAHQLRTPLSGLKWTLHMLINGDFGELTNEQKVFLMKSYENNERMISLVNDMLAADRIESGRTKFEQIKINLRDLIENVLFEVSPNAIRRQVKVVFDNASGDIFTVLVDATKIRAVIQNLLENSVKYTPAGGTVTLRIEKLNGNYLVILKDTGIGIPKEQQPQIFSRFFRASNAIKVETSGTGLGLYMVKKIIELHGGKCWFESEENKGTTFYFTLPAYKDK